jgi:hypothetical protein
MVKGGQSKYGSVRYTNAPMSKKTVPIVTWTKKMTDVLNLIGGISTLV